MAKKSPYGALRYDPDLYRASTSDLIFTEREARSEYRRLAKLANARLETLARRGLSDAQVLKKFPASFASAAGRSENEVRKRLSDVAHFMSLKTTSYRGQREAQRNMIETMREHGYEFVNRQNIGAFQRFMAAAKKHAKDKKSFDSERLVEEFEQMWEDGEIDPDMTEVAFEEYLIAGETEEIEEPEEAGAEVVRERKRPQKTPPKTARQRERSRTRAQQQRQERARERSRERERREKERTRSRKRRK